MKKENPLSDFLGGKGFYAALAFCMVGAVAAAWITVNNTLGGTEKAPSAEVPKPSVSVKEDVYDKSRSPFSAADVASPKEDVAVSETEQEVVLEFDEGAEAEAFHFFNTKKNFSYPVEGTVTKPHSGGELVKYDALNEWRTHDGIDIKADVGAEVCACGDGTVTKVWDDPLWGTCVEIGHKDNLVSLYYGLAKEVAVTENAEVKAGDLIGTVGETNLAEIADESHLHFALKQNGKFINPEEKLG